MKRRLPHIPMLSTLSFLLLTTTIVLWARSRHHADAVGFYTPAGHLDGLSSDKGGMLLFLSNIPFGREMGLSADAMSVPADDFLSVHDLLFDPTNAKWNFIGFHFAGGTLLTWGWKYSALIVPYWALVLVLVILPVASFRGIVIRLRRKRRGQCLTCGYDLRHSQDRCPECGMPVRGGSVTAPDQVPVKSAPITFAGMFPWLVLGVVIAAAGTALARGRRSAARAITAPPEVALLDRPIEQLDLPNIGLERGIDLLALAAHVPITVDWKSLDGDGTARRTPLFASLRGVHLVPALRALCDEAETGNTRDFQVWADSRAVCIGPPSAAPRVVRSYPVGDLLDRIQANLDRNANDSKTLNPGARFGVSNALYSLHPYQGPTDSREALSDLLMYAVRPDDWRESRGTLGELRIFARRLWVWQTQEGHAEVRRLLAEIRSPINPATEPATAPAVHPHANLDQKIAELNLESTTLEGAIETLRRQTQANIIVYWASLEAAGYTRDMPIRMHLWDVTVGSALNAILVVAGPDVSTMSIVRDGIILVATADVLRNSGSVVKVYDVRDLIDQLRSYDRHELATTLPATGASTASASDSNGRDPISVEEAVESITKNLEDVVDTDSWKDNGGAVGSLRSLGGMLIITQMPEAHRKIGDALRALRTGGSKEGTQLFRQ